MRAFVWLGQAVNGFLREQADTVSEARPAAATMAAALRAYAQLSAEASPAEMLLTVGHRGTIRALLAQAAGIDLGAGNTTAFGDACGTFRVAIKQPDRDSARILSAVLAAAAPPLPAVGSVIAAGHQHLAALDAALAAV